VNRIALLLPLAALAVLAGCAQAPKSASVRADAEEYVEFRIATYAPEPDFIEVWPKISLLPGQAYIAPVAALNEADLRSAQSHRLGEEGYWAVGIEFTEEGARRVARLTSKNVGRYIALILDREVIMVIPVIGPITKSRMLFAANLQMEDATDLANRIDARIPQENK